MRKELRDFKTLCIKKNIPLATARGLFKTYRIDRPEYESDQQTNLRIMNLMINEPHIVEHRLRTIEPKRSVVCRKLK
jgi:hypothetical protein